MEEEREDRPRPGQNTAPAAVRLHFFILPTCPHLDVFLVFAHPEPNSFNGALTRIARETLGIRGT